MQMQNNQSFMENVENKEMRRLLNMLAEGIPPPESQLNLDFFQDNNKVKKTRKSSTKYSNTKVKTKYLLTNVSYRRYKPEDIEKTNFVSDVFSFLTQNLNPMGLDRKLETPLERDYVKMVWGTCIPHKFCKFILFKRQF